MSLGYISPSPNPLYNIEHIAMNPDGCSGFVTIGARYRDEFVSTRSIAVSICYNP